MMVCIPTAGVCKVNQVLSKEHEGAVLVKERNYEDESRILHITGALYNNLLHSRNWL